MLELILAAALANADAPQSRNDFAYGHEVRTESGKSFAELVVPEDVYKGVKQPDLSDLGVFNEKDELVPHALLYRAPKEELHSFEPEPLTVFTVYEGKKGEAPFSHVRAATTADGAIVELRIGKAPAPKGKRVAGYLIDASKVLRPIHRLQVRTGRSGDFFAGFSLEGSQDLEKWDRLYSDGVIARFKMGTEELVKNEMRLPMERYRYFRVTWNDTQEEATILGVEALFESEMKRLAPPWAWNTVTGKMLPEPANGTAYLFDTGGSYPVSAVQVRFPDPNSFARLSFEGANQPTGSWTQVGAGFFFSVLKDGKPLQDVRLELPENRFRYWRVKILSSPGGVGKAFPTVDFGWRADHLYFLARGAGPFTLAYGSASFTNPQQPDVLRMQRDGNGAPATAGAKITLGGDAKLVAVPKTDTAAWRKTLLAAVLLGGVVLLGGMAIQVKREIPKGE